MNIRQAQSEDLKDVLPLFKGYLKFYRKEADPDTSKRFLMQRLENEEATIFYARNDGGEAMGFTLLYPTFSSVSMAPILTLNDLFVHPEHRRSGVGKALLSRAVDYARANNYARLQLETEITNKDARRLYELEGWIRDEELYHYTYTL